MTTYKDNFSLDGRIRVANGVSRKKVSKVQELYEQRNAGSLVADAELREAMTSSDAIFNYAHFATLNFLPNYDEAPREWKNIAGVREVPDFNAPTLFSIARSWTNGGGEDESSVLGGGVADVSPEIPEGTPYPYAYFKGQTAQGAKVKKRGFKVDWTLEAQINDGISFLDTVPDAMEEVALDTEEYEVFSALVNQGKSKPLAGGPLPNGDSVPANSVLTRNAVERAIIEIAERKILGRNIRVTKGYNLIVPVGVKPFIEYQLALVDDKIINGNRLMNAPASNPFGAVTVIESEYLSGNEWFLLPKVGGTRRPVLDRLELRGYRTPQLFVDNRVGTYIGAASVSPFEGSFDADVITLKLRQFGDAVLWDEGEAVIYSNGTGV